MTDWVLSRAVPADLLPNTFAAMEWIYEAIDLEVTVETRAGRLVKGRLAEIDQRMNLTVLAGDRLVLVPSTEVSAVVLPAALAQMVPRDNGVKPGAPGVLAMDRRPASDHPRQHPTPHLN